MIHKTVLTLSFLPFSLLCISQQNPCITSWLQNTALTGNYYVNGNSALLPNNILVNCQEIEYSANWVYVHTTGIPAYPTGPFLDGNPSQATNQSGIFKITLNPVPNTGTPTATTGGNIGLFINGVALFDYRDGVSWNTASNSLCGGPGNPPCPGGPTASLPWNRDAVVAEKAGFDCSKGHPAQGNYHHHQNPSAFNLDLNVISTICNLYDAEGLYGIDSTQHSPLIGFAYDGYPIYGAYAFKNTDGSGGIVRMKSSYRLRSISNRSTWADGTDVADGPAVNSTYPLGYFREDYEYIPTSASTPDFLDEHNGRFCVTPEYPNGTYCYFATVDQNWNSAYPYVIGPTFYGIKNAMKVTSVTEATSVYNAPVGITQNDKDVMKITTFPNPVADFIAVQTTGLVKENILLQLYDVDGKLVNSAQIRPGSTSTYFDIQTLYNGNYLLKWSLNGKTEIRKITVQH